jgi:2-oxoacid:acceptor oxidoreductase delta subunit (pyruvate/2-ketoisovalerate family)
MVPGERSVTVAVGHGKKAARHLDGYLRGKRYLPPPKPELASFSHLNTWYYSDAERSRQPVLDLLRRQSGFSEIHAGLNAETALFEARRCLSCGNCFECDNCYGVCPDNAVIKKGPGNRYEFNYDFCKGCGLCAQECPCGAIAMENETI